MIAAEALQDRREEDGGDALERPDVDASDLAGEEAVDRIAGGVDAGDDAPGVVEHQLAERCQLDRPRPARTVEQGSTNEAFEGGDLLADG